MAELESRFEATRSPVLSTRAMVSSNQPLATRAGVLVLERGGNAADAAVATGAALAVTEPNNSGLGGDCFALYYDAATGDVSALNGSGRAPRELNLERLRAEGFHRELPPQHPYTVTVPGACAGWFDLVDAFGSAAMADILAPAIELAEAGFPVSPRTAGQWALLAETQLGVSPGGRELLMGGRAPRPGEVFRNPGLARCLRGLAEAGRSAFYEGPVARAIANAVRAQGGALGTEDLAQHRSTWDPPISIDYRGLRVWECPPNGQGLAALLALSIVRGFDLGELDPMGPERHHLMVEAMRLAFEDARRNVADPEFFEVPLEELLSEEHAAGRRAQIAPTHRARAPGGAELRAGKDTVYLCTVDAAGNACSFINSNYMGFGTGIVPEGLGFSLQNRGHGFSLDPEHPCALAPGKRPYHTIIPGLLTRVEDGSLYGPFGVMGGFMQPQGHLQTVVAMVDDGLDPQAALDRPRFCLEGGAPDGRLAVEAELPESCREGLAARGHDVHVKSGWGKILFGRGQIIRRDSNGVLWGGSDPRGDGCAAGL